MKKAILLLVSTFLILSCSKKVPLSPRTGTVPITYSVVMATPNTYTVSYLTTDNKVVTDEQFTGTAWSKTVNITKNSETGYYFSSITVAKRPSEFESPDEVLTGESIISEGNTIKVSRAIELTSADFMSDLYYDYTGQ